MFGIGMTELMIILGLALVVIGPQKMPAVAKALGRGLNEFRRATQEIKKTIDIESYAVNQPSESDAHTTSRSSDQSSATSDAS